MSSLADALLLDKDLLVDLFISEQLVESGGGGGQSDMVGPSLSES